MPSPVITAGRALGEDAAGAPHAPRTRRLPDQARFTPGRQSRLSRRRSPTAITARFRNAKWARDKPYPPYARSTERAPPTSSVAITIFPPVNVV